VKMAHPRRMDNLRRIEALDPTADYLEVYQRTALYDFKGDMRLGLTLAFYRTFSTPEIAGLLRHTGELERRPAKRGYDTALVMFELIASGFEQPRGREMVKLLNKVHHRWDISDEDYLYVLTTFIVVPARWIDANGWRPMTDAERLASVVFYRELGRRMNIPNLPTTYKAAERIFDTYEAQNLRASAVGTELMAATLSLFADRMPRPLRPTAAPLISALIGDARLSGALGLPVPSRVLAAIVSCGLRARNVARRLTPAPQRPWFTPGQPAGDVYKDGYDLRQLGPDT
jgi:hypothetical protein